MEERRADGGAFRGSCLSSQEKPPFDRVRETRSRSSFLPSPASCIFGEPLISLVIFKTGPLARPIFWGPPRATETHASIL